MTKVEILYGSYEGSLKDKINSWLTKHGAALVQDIKITADEMDYTQ